MRTEAPLLPLLLDGAWRRARRAAALYRGLPHRSRWLLGASAACVLALAVALARSGARLDEVGEARVTRGPLRITVALSGVLSPAHAESYGAEVPGVEMKIAELAPEGAQVAVGDLLIRFEDAPFQRELSVAEGRRIQTQSESEQAKQALAALVATRQTELSDAEAAVRRAELDLKTFVNGTAPLAVQQSAAAVERAKREAEDARIKLEGLEPFAEKGYVSREELRGARLRSDQAEADLVLSEQQHRTLVTYTHPQQLAQKTAELSARREALKNARAKGDAQVAQARAAWQLAKARADEAERTVGEARRRVALCQVRARSAGLVVYRDIYEKGGERRRVREGDTVFSGQPVLDLPDLGTIQLLGRVRESDIHHIEPGQKAEVRLDAFPERSLAARVVRLGSLSGSEKAEARTFPLVLQLAATDPRFRPGMSGRALVSCGEVADALQVPVDAVRYDGDQAWVNVKGVTGPVKRKIQTGKSNAFYVAVTAGLSEGDVVLIGGR